MNDDDQGPLLCGTIAAALFSATALSAARLYCSSVVLRRTRREDIAILLSLIFLWASCILTILAVASGMGKHVDTLTPGQRAGAMFYYLVSVWPALLAITVPKVAVAGLIIRIFTPGVWTKTVMVAVVGIGIANYIVISGLSTFQCVPLAAAWDPRVPAIRCVSAKIYLDLCYFTSTYSASVDCFLAVYPALVFRKMGFSIIKKIGLSAVLGLGIGVTVVACLKISHLHVLSNEDFTWTLPRLTIWTITEATVTIVAACIPVLHPLYDRARAAVRRAFPSLQRRHAHHQRASTTNTTTTSTVNGRRGRRRRRREGRQVRHAPDSPGFWSLKLRAIAVAESWWSSTAGRSGVRGGGGGQTEEEDGSATSRRRVSGTGAVNEHDNAHAPVVLQGCEGGGNKGEHQSRELTIRADRVTELELSDLERGPGDRAVGGHDPGPRSSGSGEHTTAVVQK